MIYQHFASSTPQPRGARAAHADNDGDGATATKIFSTSWSENFTRDSAAWRAYVEAYQLGRKEG